MSRGAKRFPGRPPRADYADDDSAMSEHELRARSALRALPSAVWALGAVSLLTDTASDMVYPLLPKLLGTVGAGAVALGFMEGLAEAIASLVKVWAGRASDRSARRGPFVVFGYGIAALARPLMAIVAHPWQIVAARTLDRMGKGVRSAPRDALIGAVTPAEHRGLAFGVHRAMDNLGAVFGPLVAYLLITGAHATIRMVFVLAVVPGALSTLLAYFAVRREKRLPAIAVDAAKTPKKPLSRDVRRLLVATAIFALGASADSFLMARLTDLGLSLSLVPIAWVTLQLGKSLLNVPGGALADRLGPRRVLIGSWLVYAVAYVAFARAPTFGWFWATLPLYAIHYGLGEGAEKSLMARVCTPTERGAAFGAQHAVHGLALLPANVLFGFLYVKSAPIAFAVEGALALIAVVALLLLTGERRADVT